MSEETQLAFRTRFVRTRTRVHRPECGALRHTTSAIAWWWAEHVEDDEWLRFEWLLPCEACCPDLAARQRELRKEGRVVTYEEYIGP